MLPILERLIFWQKLDFLTSIAYLLKKQNILPAPVCACHSYWTNQRSKRYWKRFTSCRQLL